MFLSEDFVLPLISTKYSRIIICNVVDSFDVINLEKSIWLNCNPPCDEYKLMKGK